LDSDRKEGSRDALHGPLGPAMSEAAKPVALDAGYAARTPQEVPGDLGGALALDRVTMTFAAGRGRAVTALSDLDIAVAPGEFVSIVGPSGCGKSTVIRLAAGLERATAGSVTIDGRPPAELAHTHELGVAFQDHALLPWLTAADNVALPFRVAGRRVEHARVAELLKLVGVHEFSGSRPRELSGGMRQRVAIARALVLDPTVLLLDEPFGSLDAVTRRRLNIEMQRVWLERPVTTVLVTHSVDEAIFLADRVLVLSGRPGQVILEENVPFSRPRPPELLVDPRLHRMEARLIEGLEAGERT
jgi:NitT/TauT family transport system ATP-binding protein